MPEDPLCAGASTGDAFTIVVLEALRPVGVLVARQVVAGALQDH